MKLNFHKANSKLIRNAPRTKAKKKWGLTSFHSGQSHVMCDMRYFTDRITICVLFCVCVHAVHSIAWMKSFYFMVNTEIERTNELNAYYVSSRNIAKIHFEIIMLIFLPL